MSQYIVTRLSVEEVSKKLGLLKEWQHCACFAAIEFGTQDCSLSP